MSSVAGERTWTLEGRIKSAPFAYKTGGGTLSPGERVEVVELSRLRAVEEKLRALKDAAEPFHRLDLDLGDEWEEVCAPLRGALVEAGEALASQFPIRDRYLRRGLGGGRAPRFASGRGD